MEPLRRVLASLMVLLGVVAGSWVVSLDALAHEQEVVDSDSEHVAPVAPDQSPVPSEPLLDDGRDGSSGPPGDVPPAADVPMTELDDGRPDDAVPGVPHAAPAAPPPSLLDDGRD